MPEINSGTDLHRLIQLTLGRLPTCRMFRNEAGEAWVGKWSNYGKSQPPKILIEYPRRVKFGLAEGASDLVGLTSIVITPQMVGQRVAVFTGIEAKFGEDRPSTEQLAFIAMVQKMGGFAGVAGSVEDAMAIARQPGVK